jgi:NTE family protein/lysophospholipid hydrolase
MSDDDARAQPSDLIASIVRAGLFGDLTGGKAGIIAAAVHKVSLAPNATLFVQGDPSDAMYLVLSGRLLVLHADENRVEALRGEVHPGEPTGEVQFLTGGRHTATVRADRDSVVIRIPRTVIERLTEADPGALDPLATLIHARLRRYRLYDMLPRLFGTLDERVVSDIERSIEWKRLGGGEVLFRQGDPGDSLYIVMSGRLRAVVRDAGGSERTVGDVTRGESVGEMALFTGEDRSASIHALRDTELIRFSKPAFEEIMAKYPQVVMQITRILVHRLRQQITSPVARESLTNLALVGADASVDLAAFCGSLVSSLSEHARAIALDSADVDRLLGTPGIAQTPPAGPHAIRLQTWLDDLETTHSLIVYRSDTGDTNWSRRCLRQADRVLIVADATRSPAPQGVEAALLGPTNAITRCSRQLVLLHPHRGVLPARTQDWLAPRTVERHYHVHPGDSRDFRRLARLLTGRGVGLVLGGGGARGYAHIGVIRALEEAGVPIDTIGGTSMGAVVAAAHALGLDYGTFISKTTDLLRRHRPFKEYTLPIVSLLGSRRLDRFLHEAYGDARIEDLEIGCFAVSSNLSTAEVEVHAAGLLWTAVRSSMSVPGVAVPVVAGGHLLIDGGVLNNLPGDVMRRLGAGTVIAVDVNAKNDLLVDDSCTPIPSPWKILWSRINPFAKRLNVPSILSILARTSLLGSLLKLNEVMRDVDLYLNPPVSHFGILDNDALEEIAETGYRYAKERVAEWLAGRRNAW